MVYFEAPISETSTNPAQPETIVWTHPEAKPPFTASGARPSSAGGLSVSIYSGP
jgi:hypothetical protein